MPPLHELHRGLSRERDPLWSAETLKFDSYAPRCEPSPADRKRPRGGCALSDDEKHYRLRNLATIPRDQTSGLDHRKGLPQKMHQVRGMYEGLPNERYPAGIA